METYNISTKPLTIGDIERIFELSLPISLSSEARANIERCRSYLDDKIRSLDRPIYGITTGFGSLCNTSISSGELEQLQENIVKSHSCGMGDEVAPRLVKLMMFLKVQALSYGVSAVSLPTVERLIYYYNHDIVPVVYQQGSLGASGDLAPLAHISLALIGKGEVYYKQERRHTADVLQELGLAPIRLQSKEGLALMNGTQFMLAHAVAAVIRAKRIMHNADKIAAASIDAYLGRIDPFDERLHTIRPHKGQIQTAENIRTYLAGSELIKQAKPWVQDPYSFRCVPQVHGASKDTLNYVLSVVTTEMNSVTDNPMVFPDADLVISGGNFHGQPLALVMDFLAIACSEIANIAERRVYRLISGERGLPPFLVAKPGLNSGFMIPQYTAASIVSQNKQLCTPASVDSISSSNEQEDHVSMGANAATKLLRVVDNVERVQAIELFAASQAMSFRKEKTSPVLQQLLRDFREQVPLVGNDIVMYEMLHKAEKYVKKML